MKKETIIIGGLFLIALDQISHTYNITHTDQIFWVVLVPIAFVGGLFIRHLCR